MKIEAVHPLAFLDVSIGGKQCGRIVIELYNEKAPKACANFLALLPQYKGTYFHRIIKNFMIQGGDIQYGQAAEYNDTSVGSGLHPDGLALEDENLDQLLDKPFMVCMANSGHKDSNGSQFFITTAPVPHLQGKHTVFGMVTHGKSVVRDVEKVSTTKEFVPLESDLPVIVNSGEWAEGDPVPIFNACYSTVGGDIYEEHPDDDEHIDKDSSKSVFDAATIIKESGGALFKKGEFENAFLKYKKALRYVMEYIPDEDQEPEYYKKYTDLKKKIYLNLSLVCLKMDEFTKCVNYCSSLLDMDLAQQEKTKTLYRLGSAMLALKKYKEAITIFQTAKEIMTDPAIERDLKKAEDLLAAEKDRERAKYAKFFG